MTAIKKPDFLKSNEELLRENAKLSRDVAYYRGVHEEAREELRDAKFTMTSEQKAHNRETDEYDTRINELEDTLCELENDNKALKKKLDALENALNDREVAQDKREREFAEEKLTFEADIKAREDKLKTDIEAANAKADAKAQATINAFLTTHMNIVATQAEREATSLQALLHNQALPVTPTYEPVDQINITTEVVEECCDQEEVSTKTDAGRLSMMMDIKYLGNKVDSLESALESIREREIRDARAVRDSIYRHNF